MNDNKNNILADDIDPMLDTGKAARAAYQMSKETCQRIIAFCEKYDRDHAVEQKRQGTVKAIIIKALSYLLGIIKTDL